MKSLTMLTTSSQAVICYSIYTYTYIYLYIYIYSIYIRCEIFSFLVKRMYAKKDCSPFILFTLYIYTYIYVDGIFMHLLTN